jgi:arylsulfatase A-like enzyme
VVYEPSIRVPILARWDALGSPPARRPELALNIDLAPTVAEATGLTNHNPFDGRSLLPLMRGESPGWRDDFLVEHKATTNEAGPSFCAVRGSRWKFVQYQTGERELFDLSVDPDEMTSLHGRTAYREVEDALHARMLELCNPPPPGWTPQ